MKSCLIPDTLKPGPSGGTTSGQLREGRTAWAPSTKWLVRSEWRKQVATVLLGLSILVRQGA